MQAGLAKKRLSLRTVERYESGERRIPGLVALAIELRTRW
jgi:hypothetical protein